jgi:two-component system sensor histidine kinase PhoQ
MIKAKFYRLLNHPQYNSLKFRLLISALLMTFIILPIIGFTLSKAFEQQIVTSIKKELTAYSYSILALAEVEDGRLSMPEQLLENQFNVIQSGLYAIISELNTDPSQEYRQLWHSNSLLGISSPTISTLPEVGNNSFSTLMIDDKKHFIFSFSVSFSSNEKNVPLTVQIIKNYNDFNSLVNDFKQQLWTWLLILMALLFLVQGFWLVWTLKPLRVLKLEMRQIEQGELNELQQKYPLELTQVTQQLNLLLRTESQQRKRYRNALSDLAHSLKTPLAVIQSQQELTQSSSEQLQLINNIIEHQLKRAQSAGESAWHTGINVKIVVDKLIATMAKIYFDKNIQFNCAIDSQASFKGDEADLLEILGNIIDNACKASKKKITISVQQVNKHLTIKIADDGDGINAEIQTNILNRGTRSDTYQEGHGIGLAIVRDLVQSYQGQLIIGSSNTLLGAKFTLVFYT